MDTSDVLKPGESIRPLLTLEEAKNLVEELYGLRCKGICELDGYDDRNFKITIKGNQNNDNKPEYVLKILNSFDSTKPNFIDAQNKLLLYLSNNNTSCPIPMLTVGGDSYTFTHLDSGKHIVRLMEFIPGILLLKAPVVSADLIMQIGSFVAKLDKTLEKFNHPVYATHKTLWMLESVPYLRKFLFAIEDEYRRNFLEEIISEFENQVLTKVEKLEKGLIHGDFNEQNILVENIRGEWRMKSVLDFGDSQYSCYLFELAITVTYIMILKKSMSSGSHVIRGYSKIRKIPEEELNLLKICIEARICQSLVMGAYSSRQDPENSYILTNAKPGWELLFKLRSTERNDLLDIWKNPSLE